MSMRSIQSDFSSAVISCLEVDIREVRTSCVEEVDFRAAVDDSEGQLVQSDTCHYVDPLTQKLRRKD